MGEGKYTMGVFLDLSKAFDKSTLKLFLKRKNLKKLFLQHHGIRGICLQWFKDYFHGRTQIVKFKHHRSIEMNVNYYRSPTGFNSWSIAISLYINDIENCSDILSFVLYADDTNAFFSNSCLKTLSSILCRVK